ncbi:MAG: glycoside hydrolase family 30 protein, partial [Bacillota bacterium]
WIALNKLEKESRDEIIKELFATDKCNFNFCRLPIGASDYAAKWYSLNEKEGDYDMEYFSIERDKSYLIPYIKEAMKYQNKLKLFASPWSPPTWMKSPQAYNYGSLIFEDKVLNAYALYFSKFVEAYAEEGIKIDQIHVQNEPMSSQKFPSCKWTGEEFRDFIRDYMGPKFKENEIETEIWLGTLNGPEVDDRFLTTRYNDYANIVLSDQKARKYISGVGYQWRGKYAVQRTKMAWPEMKLMQTENECGDGKNTWEYSRYVFDLIWHYFVNGVSSYIYWNMVLEPGGESTWGWNQNSMITVDPETQEVIYNPEFYLMKHFSKFVKRGAVRFSLKGSWNANSLGFKNLDGSKIIVIHNPFKELKTVNIKTNNKNISVELKPLSFNTIEF